MNSASSAVSAIMCSGTFRLFLCGVSAVVFLGSPKVCSSSSQSVAKLSVQSSRSSSVVQSSPRRYRCCGIKKCEPLMGPKPFLN